MKITGTIITIIVMIIAGILVPFLIRQRPDVRYTLSDPIRIGQTEGTGKIWQQIEVKNKGNIEAKDIKIKINAPISQNEVAKNSEADKVEEFATKDSLEFSYPSLPPNGAFTITVASLEKQIVPDNISVLLSNGIAIEAFSKRSSFLFWLIPWIFAGLFSTFYLVLSLITGKESSFDYKARYEPIEGVLKKKKPFFIESSKWLSIRLRAIEKAATTWNMGDISISELYRTLSNDPPSFLNQDEWEIYRKKAIDGFKDEFTKKVSYAYRTEHLLLFVQLKQPKHLPESDWIDLHKDASNRYMVSREGELFIADKEKLRVLLKEEKPEGLSSDVWYNYYKRFQREYYEQLKRELDYSLTPNEDLDKNDLSHLSEDSSSQLRNIAYRRGLQLLPDVRTERGAKDFLSKTKQKWIKDSDYNEYKNMAEKTLKLERMEEELGTKEEHLVERESKVSTESNEIAKKLNKINSQLQIINEVLSDPTVLERIEDYNNTFASGNFANLKKIGELLKKTKDSSQK